MVMMTMVMVVVMMTTVVVMMTTVVVVMVAVVMMSLQGYNRTHDLSVLELLVPGRRARSQLQVQIGLVHGCRRLQALITRCLLILSARIRLQLSYFGWRFGLVPLSSLGIDISFFGKVRILLMLMLLAFIFGRAKSFPVSEPPGLGHAWRDEL